LKLAASEEGNVAKRCASRNSRTEARFFKRIDKLSSADGDGWKASVWDEIPDESFEDDWDREVGWVRRQSM